MKTTEQKRIALLERMGWKYNHPHDNWILPNGKTWQHSVQITHTLMDEAWEWMKGLPDEEGEIVRREYGLILARKVASTVLSSEDGTFHPTPMLRHMPAEQDFECACQALGIE